MKGTSLSESELSSMRPGEAITLSAVMAVLAIALVSVICYRIFMTKEGSAKIPGGWQFRWA
jgi:hypothetical protein